MLCIFNNSIAKNINLTFTKEVIVLLRFYLYAVSALSKKGNVGLVISSVHKNLDHHLVEEMMLYNRSFFKTKSIVPVSCVTDYELLGFQDFISEAFLFKKEERSVLYISKRLCNELPSDIIYELSHMPIERQTIFECFYYRFSKRNIQKRIIVNILLDASKNFPWLE